MALPQEGVAFEYFVALTDLDDTDRFQANPTIVVGDAKVLNATRDGLDNADTLPTVIGATKVVHLQWSAAEMATLPQFMLLSDQSGTPQWPDLLVILSGDSVIVSELLDEAVEGAYTWRQILRLLAAAIGGEASGGGTATITFRDLNDTRDRIELTVDANGNRSAVTLDLT